MKDGVKIREFYFSDADYQALAALRNLNFPEDRMHPDEIRTDDNGFDTTKFLFRRLVAERDGQMAGYVEFNHRPARFHPKRFWIWVETHPKFQGQEIGRRLYEVAVNELKEFEPIAYQTAARETMQSSIVFLKNRDFREVSRTFQSHLDLEHLRLDSFKKQSVDALKNEITITTLAEAKQHDPDWLNKCYELHLELGQDVPSTDAYTPISLENFVHHTIENQNALLDGYFIALDGARHAGECYLQRMQSEPTALFQAFTGVRREYRRQGIAWALKLKAAEYAKQKGFKSIKTMNDSTNTGMLAINDQMGFVRETAWIKFEKTLRNE